MNQPIFNWSMIFSYENIHARLCYAVKNCRWAWRNLSGQRTRTDRGRSRVLFTTRSIFFHQYFLKFNWLIWWASNEVSIFEIIYTSFQMCHKRIKRKDRKLSSTSNSLSRRRFKNELLCSAKPGMRTQLSILISAS